MTIRKYFRKLRKDVKNKFARPGDSSKPSRKIKLITTAPFLKYQRNADPLIDSLLTIRNPASSDNITISSTTLVPSSSPHHSADEILFNAFATPAHDMLSSSIALAPSSSCPHSSFETATPSSSNSDQDFLFQSPLTRLTRAIRAGTFPPNISACAPTSPTTQGVPYPLDQNEESPTPTAPLNPRAALRQHMSYLLTARASLADPTFPRKRPACASWGTSPSKQRVLLAHRDLGSCSSIPRARASASRTRTLNAIPTVAVVLPAEEAQPPSPVSSRENFSSRLLRALPNFLFRNFTPAPAPAPVESASDFHLPVPASFRFTFTSPAPAPVVPPISISISPPSPPPSPSPSPSPSRPPPRKRARTFPQEPTHEFPPPNLAPGAASCPEEEFFRCLALCEGKFAEMEALSRRLDEVVGELGALL